MRKPVHNKKNYLFILTLFFFIHTALNAAVLTTNTLSVFCTPIAPASDPMTDNGSVQIVVNEASTPFELVLYNVFNEVVEAQTFHTSSINLTLTGLAAGSYTLEVTDANSDLATCDFTIEVDDCSALSATIENVMLSCPEDLATLSVIAENGVVPYSYEWNTGATSSTINNLGVGNYSVTVTDNANCSIVVSGEVIGISPIFLNVTEVQAASTPTSTDGRILVTLHGENSPFDYIILDDQQNIIRNGNTTILGNAFVLNSFTAGNYTMIIHDTNGCSKTLDFTVTTATCELDIVLTETPILCQGDLARLDFEISGGVTPYTIIWDNIETMSNSLELTAGNYSFLIKDNIGCTTTITHQIFEPNALIINCSVLQEVSITGGTDGQVSFLVSGGTAPYDFEMLDNDLMVIDEGHLNQAGTIQLGGLSADDYTISIKDALDCTNVCNFSITEPTCEMEVVVENDAVACFGDLGNLSATVTGGVLPYQYFWSNAVIDAAISNWPAGDYALSVTDANGCRKVVESAIVQPNMLSVTCQILQQGEASGNPTGIVSSQIIGGTSPYTLHLNGESIGQSDGSILLENLIAQDYQLIITDANACMIDCSFSIFPCDVLLEYTSENILCRGANDGSISLELSNATEPITYDWNNADYDGLSQLDNLSAGIYQVVVTDANDCIRQQMIEITEPLVGLDLSCQIVAQNQGNQIYYTIDGLYTPYEVIISGMNFLETATHFENGTYQVTIPSGTPNITIQVTDGLGCVVSCENDLGVANCASFSPTAYINGGNCSMENAFATLHLQGGTPPYFFEWSDGVTSMENHIVQANTMYHVTIVDATNCLKVTSIFIPETANNLEVQLESSHMLCENGTTTLSAIVSGGLPPYEYYWWANGSEESTLVVNTEDWYQVLVIDQNNCTKQVGIQVTTGGLEVQGSDVLIACEETIGQAQVLVSGGTTPYTFEWSNGSMEATPLLAIGEHQVTVSDANACSGTSSLTVIASEGSIEIQNCPEQMQVTLAEDQNTIPVHWDSPTVISNCGYNLSSNFQSGDAFPLGFSIVDYRVTTLSGAMDACIFVITVLPFDLNNENLSVPRLEARKKEQTTVVSWFPETEEEVNVLFYELEKSQNAQDFEFLVTINKKTSTSSRNAYVEIDEQPHAGDNYYRLKIYYDNDEIAYSNLRNVAHHIEENDLTLFPNPVQDELVVYLPVLKTQMATIQIYNGLGQIVRHLEIEVQPEQATYLDVRHFQKGLYTLTAKVATRRMMVEKFVVDQGD